MPRPSDQVIATRAPVVVERPRAARSPATADAAAVAQQHQRADAGRRRAARHVSGRGRRPRRFELRGRAAAGDHRRADRRSRCRTPGCTTSSAAGKREWEQTFDAISDPIAVFDSRGRLLRGNTALAASSGGRSPSFRRTSCQQRRVLRRIGPDACAVARALAIQRRAAAPRSRSPTGRFSASPRSRCRRRRGASVVQVAKNVTEEIRSRAPAAADERRAGARQRRG